MVSLSFVISQIKGVSIGWGGTVMIGLKRGTVELYDHEKEWEIEAQHTISRLKAI